MMLALKLWTLDHPTLWLAIQRGLMFLGFVALAGICVSFTNRRRKKRGW